MGCTCRNNNSEFDVSTSSSTPETLDTAAQPVHKEGKQKRRALNAMLQPFLQFKLLLYMLGSTVVVALLLSAFLYFAFSEMVSELSSGTGNSMYHAEMIEIQLVHLFRYCGVLFILYVLLLAIVCVSYTHKLIGPFQPFNRHVDSMIAGDYQARVALRKGDPDLLQDYANKLNALAEKLEKGN